MVLAGAGTSRTARWKPPPRSFAAAQEDTGQVLSAFFQCDAGVPRPIGQPSTFQTTDPGPALITGKCADVGKMKGPVLRGLSARPPYFHNGSAATLQDVVNFYDQRFAIGMTGQQKADLVAFLRSL